jgi:hypothetical protein
MPSATRLIESDTRIEEGVQDVDGQVDDHKDDPVEHRRAEHGRSIQREARFRHELTESGQVEDRFRDHDTAQQPGDLNPEIAVTDIREFLLA